MMGNSNKLLILIPLAIVLAGALIAGSFLYINKSKTPKESLASPQEVAQKALNFINQNLLEGLTATLTEVTEENDLYKLKLKIDGQEYTSYVSKNGKFLFPGEGINLEEAPKSKAQTEKSTIGNFSVSTDAVCKENEKPIIYFFGSKSCPHCAWEHPVMEKVAKDFEGYISFHNNMDSDKDSEVFAKYSQGGIPTLVFGCKYFRMGSGEESGEEEETKVLKALICKLTENQPTNVCNSVQDLINQIGE